MMNRKTIEVPVTPERLAAAFPRELADAEPDPGPFARITEIADAYQAFAERRARLRSDLADTVECPIVPEGSL